MTMDENEGNVVYTYKIQKSKSNPLKGPIRVARLCVLSVIFPGLLLGIPLYMRYNVYIQQVYPLGMSDIRIIDARISTTWCQSQVVWSNTTFNAYLMSEQPQIQTDLVKVSMTRHLMLEDDMKEYWGFYLLQGSTVTVSTCVRWPGASLIMIRGHKHLKQCAYIGDDSSEELDELQEAFNGTSGEDSNEPEKMKKVMSGVVLHDHENISEVDDDSSTLHHHHHHHQHHPKITYTPKEMQEKFGKVDNKKEQNVHLAFADQILNPNLVNIKDKKDYKLKLNLDVPGSKELKEMAKKPQTSGEVYEDILSKLETLGDKKKDVLNRLQDKLETDEFYSEDRRQEEAKQRSESSIILDKLKKLAANQEHELKKETKVKSTEEDEIRRRKRQVSFGKRLERTLTTDDAAGDVALEEEAHSPDGIADIRGTLNETTAKDMSNSEFWSSFSSSEERLLQCEGLLLNLPLTPHRKCEAHRTEAQLAAAAGPNTVTYKVPMNGYYFFVFNSENEVQANFLRIHFRLEKTTYNVSHAVASCKNQIHPCSLPLKFWSSDKVILELPVRANDSLWNQEFLAVSTCEPRTAIYIGCVVAVPLLIILFAFQ